jgi:hypothetical protein
VCGPILALSGGGVSRRAVGIRFSCTAPEQELSLSILLDPMLTPQKAPETLKSVQQSCAGEQPEDTMSVTDQALKSNEQYAKAYDPRLGRSAAACHRCGDPWHGSRLSDARGNTGQRRYVRHSQRRSGPSRMKCRRNWSF